MTSIDRNGISLASANLEESMATSLRVATFNLENLDEEEPTLDERIALMRPQLLRLQARRGIPCSTRVRAKCSTTS